MTELKEGAERTHRVVGRGRDERTPYYLHLGVLVVVVVSLVFLVQALAS
jgi:hypothetical protein